jgi:hypothetical protein
VLDVDQKHFQLWSSHSIHDLYSHHIQVSDLLESFRLPGFCDDPLAKGKYKYPGGLQLSTLSVLKEALGLSPITYRKKSKAFVWAEAVHTYVWNGSQSGIFFFVS